MLDAAVLANRTYAATFIEPGVFGRVGSGPVIFEWNMALVFPLARQPEGDHEPVVGADWLTHKTARFGLGVALEFGSFYGRRR